LLIALPSAICAICYLKQLLSLIVLRNETVVSYPEGASVYGFLTAFQTHRLYHSPFEFPWNAQLFGPVFLMAGAWFARILHGDPNSTTELMRSVSFLALLGSIAIVGYLCWRLERQIRWAAAAMLLALGCSWLVPFASVARPDTPSIFLMFAALAFYETAEGKLWFFYLAGVLSALSILTKQNTAPALLGLLIDCLWARKFSKAAQYVAGGMTASILILLPLWLRHELFLANFAAIRFVVPDWPSVPRMLDLFIRSNEIAAVAIFIAVLGAAWSWKDRRYRSILLATALAWLSNVAALANAGGAYNYLILPWLLTMLFVPAGIKRLEQWGAHAIWIPAALFLFAAAITYHQRDLLANDLPGPLDASIVADLNVLSDMPYLELRSRQPQMLDPYTYNELSLRKAWSDAPLRQRIDAENYDLVLIAEGNGGTEAVFSVRSYRGISFWGVGVIREITLHYRPLCETSDHLALVPLDRAVSISSETIAHIFHEPCRVSRREPQVASGAS